MWVLIAVFMIPRGMTSQQVEFKHQHECQKAKKFIEEDFESLSRGFKAYCIYKEKK